ncbi:hypothetical protein Tco_0383202 [Tanacetum coccineum]
MTESSLMDSSLAVLVFSLGDDPIAYLNKAIAFLTVVASSRFPSTNNQLKTSLNPRGHATIQNGRVTVQQVQGRQGQSYFGTSYKSNATSFGGNNASRQSRVVKCYNCQDEEKLAFLADPGVPDGQAVQTIIPNNAAFQTEDLDTYDSDCDDVSNAKAVLIANISNYGSDVISKEKAIKEQNNESVTDELERYKERVKTFEQRLNIDLSSREKMIDSQMDDMIKEKLALKEQVDSLEQNLSKQIKEKESRRIKPTLYDGIAISDKHVAIPVIDDEVTLILEEESRSKMSEKEKDPKAIKQNISHKPIDYVKLNRLSDDFGKRFVPQQELSVEQTFWYHMSNPSSKSSDASSIKMEAPKELPKIRTTPDARTKDLKAQTQDKVFMITSLKNDLQKLKGKEIVDIAAQIPSANTIVPGMFKLNLDSLAPRLLQNREAHIDYLKYTQEQADILRGIVKQAKAK